MQCILLRLSRHRLTNFQFIKILKNIFKILKIFSSKKFIYKNSLTAGSAKNEMPSKAHNEAMILPGHVWKKVKIN